MAHDMYLTYEEYLALGGAIDAAAWPPLECACRKRIDRITDCRVQNMAEVPKAVKLCIFALAQMESAVGPVAQVTSPTVTSFSTDGYTENHGNVPNAEVTHILIFQNQLSHLIHTRQMIFTKDEATLPLCAGTLIFMFRPVYGFMLMTLRQVTLLLVPHLTVQEHSLSRRQKASGKAAVKVL